MDAFSVDSARCRKDGICAAVCPMRLIRGGVGEYPDMDDGAEQRCFSCGQCMAFCPAQACAAPGLSVEECRMLRRDFLPQPDQVEELVFSRRSIRNYREEPLPRALLQRLLDTVRYAPSARNLQNLRWIVFTSREQVVELVRLTLAWLGDLPRTDPVLARALRPEDFHQAWDKGIDLITRGAPQLVLAVAAKNDWGSSDAAIALTYLEILAHAHRAGCCWGGYLCRAFEHPAGGELRVFLGLADREKVYGAQMIGYPRYAAFSRPSRIPPRINWR